MFVEEYLRDLRRRRYSPGAFAEYAARCAIRSAEAAWGRPRVLRSVALAGLGHLVGLFAIAVAVSFLVDRRLAVDYFIVSAWWLLGGLAWITLHLGMFREDRELFVTGLGLPNFLTLGRLLAIPAFYIFLTGGHEILALVVVLALSRAGYFPVWILVLVLLRYGLLMFGAAYIYVTRGPVAIRPTVLGKTTGVITTALVAAVVIVYRFFPSQAADQVLDLLYAVIGFVLLLTTVQVVIIGFYNMRHAGHVPEAHGAMAVILGKRATGEEFPPGEEPPPSGREGGAP
jgi:phosphatidylglycerophosphate synthase